MDSITFAERSRNHGSVLLVTVFTFLVFLIITIASVRFINRQFRATVNSEAEAMSFRLADDGVDYTLFLLGSGAATVSSLAGGTQPVEQTVSNPASGQESGTFSLTFAADVTHPTEVIRVTSVGTSVQSSSQCYTINAEISRVADANLYTVTSWSSTSSC